MLKNIHRYYIIIFITLCLFTCKKDENRYNPENISSDEWIIDTNLMTGTSINYQFPVVTKPIFYTIENVNPIQDDVRVYVCRFDNQTFIFPQNYLWVEAVNYHTENHYFAITFCPITKSAMIWDRIKTNDTLTFAASGILYKENLVAYDIETESMWSQMAQLCIKGKFVNEKPKILNFFETNWLTAKEYFTEALVYQSFENNKSHSKLVNKKDTSDYESGDRVFGIISGSLLRPSVYTLNIDKQDERIKTHLITVQGNKTIVLSDKEFNYAVAFNIETSIDYSPTSDFPVILSDSEGNYWNVFGFAVLGPRTGERLKSAPSFTASWWAWEDFYEILTPLE